MKSRWFWFWICIVCGFLLLGCGLLVPVHLRALDVSIIYSAGRSGDTLLQRGKSLAENDQLGAAQLFASAGRAVAMPGWDRLGETITNRAAQNAAALFWGNDTRTKSLFGATETAGSFSSFIIRRASRETALAHLQGSMSPAVHELLRCRALTHTVLIPPSPSPSGQAFDAVVAECGLLMDGSRLTSTMSGHVQQMAEQANHGAGSQLLEQTLLDFASLGERMNWDQLTVFVKDIPDPVALHLLAGQMSAAGDRMPVLYAAVQMSGEPAGLAQYLYKFPQTGLQDISAAVWYGGNGVKKLAAGGQRYYRSDVMRWFATRDPFGAIYYFAAARSLQNPWLVLAVKWFLFFAAGFCFALALHFSRPPVSDLETPLQVRGIHVFQEIIFSLGFLLVVLLLSEPFLAQESQKGASLRLQLPMVGSAVPASIAEIKQTIMNPTIFLTLLVFFVLQTLIYISCLVKLAEIRRQQVPPRMKLKLLENEDHLFDAGLYLGFVGTIVSLIIASMGWVKFSLMAAYSSTSFGIIFVVVFKIFHLRPARRKLLIEAELAEAAAAGRPAGIAASEPASEPALTA